MSEGKVQRRRFNKTTQWRSHVGDMELVVSTSHNNYILSIANGTSSVVIARNVTGQVLAAMSETLQVLKETIEAWEASSDE